jgi:hypothetical protein
MGRTIGLFILLLFTVRGFAQDLYTGTYGNNVEFIKVRAWVEPEKEIYEIGDTIDAFLTITIDPTDPFLRPGTLDSCEIVVMLPYYVIPPEVKYTPDQFRIIEAPPNSPGPFFLHVGEPFNAHYKLVVVRHRMRHMVSSIAADYIPRRYFINHQIDFEQGYEWHDIAAVFFANDTRSPITPPQGLDQPPSREDMPVKKFKRAIHGDRHRRINQHISTDLLQ